MMPAPMPVALRGTRAAGAPRANPPFRHAQRVYWEDTDAGGVVYYANYLKFFERARTEWLRHLGVEQQALRESSGAIFVVTHAAIHYLAPARLDDRLELTVALQHAGRASMTMAQQAWCGENLLAEAEVRIGCVDAQRMRPCRIPDQLLHRLA